MQPAYARAARGLTDASALACKLDEGAVRASREDRDGAGRSAAGDGRDVHGSAVTADREAVEVEWKRRVGGETSCSLASAAPAADACRQARWLADAPGRRISSKASDAPVNLDLIADDRPRRDKELSTVRRHGKLRRDAKPARFCARGSRLDFRSRSNAVAGARWL